MNITNIDYEIPGPDIAQPPVAAVDSHRSRLPDLAGREFRENDVPGLSLQEVPDKETPIPELAPNVLQPPNGFSEEDLLKAIPEALKFDDRSEFPGGDVFSPSVMDSATYYPVAEQKRLAQFSFLDDARPLFTEIENTAGNQGKPELQGKIPDNKPLAKVPGNGFKEISSPYTEGAVNKTEAVNQYSAPDFLPDRNQPETEEIAANYERLSIEPLVVPAVKIAAEHFDVNAVRRDFPILSEKVNGKNLVWLDNAATTQKPKRVIDRLVYFYEHENSNVHRGAHTLAARSTDAYEGARETISRFLNASSATEIVFVRGATEAINLVAQSWGKYNLQKDDEIIITWLEHHANIVPWQMICSETGAKLRVVPVDETGQVLLAEYERLLGPKTKIVAVTHVSNALGTITPVAEMVNMAHRYGARVLVDGAQAVSHLKVDVQALDCDFYVFSGHKVFGPSGIGALYAKSEVLNAMRPYHGGGNMIVDVTFEKTVYQVPPHRFEAGTGNIADAVGLGTAIDYVNSLGIENISRYEHNLLEYGLEALQRIPGLRLIGTAKEKASVLSFGLEGFTTEEIGRALSQEGIAVRAGHHCAQPILRNFGMESTVRPSLAFYNTCEELDALVSVLWELKKGRHFG